jgi:hypothetical protein
MNKHVLCNSSNVDCGNGGTMLTALTFPRIVNLDLDNLGFSMLST